MSEMCPKIEKATEYQWLLSGWQDSNLRPPRPKRGAITGLRYTPKNLFIKERKAERQGFEPWQHLRVDRLAICSITTLAPLLYFLYHYERTTLKLRLQM